MFLVLLLSCLVGANLLHRQGVVHLYVAPNGSDIQSGTESRPVASLDQALSLLKQQRRSVDQAAIIEFAPGTYSVGHAVDLGPDARNLTLKATTPGSARLFGGRVLTAWHEPDAAVKARLKPSAADHVLQADLSSAFTAGWLERRGFGVSRKKAGAELYFAGKPMPIAAFPNEGEWLRTADPANDSSFHYTSDEPNTWKDTKDIWMLGYWNYDWAESYERVSSLDTDQKVISIAPEKTTYGIKPGRRFRFINVLEALDSPGEWYVDREQNHLYFWPPSGVSASEAYLSELKDPMFRVSGTADVTFDGLVLEGGRDGAIDVKKSSRIVVANSLIRNFGTYGVAFSGCLDSGVRGCDLTGLGEEGISLDGGNRRTLSPGRLFAEDNHIWAYARWTRTYQPAVRVSGVGNRVANNKIHDAPHNAILLSGNDHVIEYNDIRRVCTETGDAGSVYMGRDPTMRGTIIRYNRFDELGPKVTTQGNYTEVMSVYLDDCWPGTLIQGNLFLAQGTGVVIGGGQDNSVINNVFINNHPAVSIDARGKGWAKGMFTPDGSDSFIKKMRSVDADQPPYSKRYPALANYLNGDPGFPSGLKVVRNVCVGGEWLSLHDNLKTSDMTYSANVFDKKGSTLSDALKLAPDGFEPLPLDKIGLKTVTGRIQWKGDRS